MRGDIAFTGMALALICSLIGSLGGVLTFIAPIGLFVGIVLLAYGLDLGHRGRP